MLTIFLFESNHNVSVCMKKSPFAMGHPFQPESVELHLLHPHDPSQNKKLSLNTSGLNEAENFITSKQLDEYCHSGKYYISC